MTDAVRVDIDPAYCFGRPRVLPSGVPTFALAGPVIYDGETMEETATWMDVTVAEVEEAVRFTRCWRTQRGPYERSFCR